MFEYLILVSIFIMVILHFLLSVSLDLEDTSNNQDCA